MVERPILFSSPMVRAVLAGAKTVTRRVVTDVRGIGRVTEFQPSDTPGYDWIMRNKRMLWNDLETSELLARCPYGEPGDRLWVRETWRTEEGEGGEEGIRFRADDTFVPIERTQEAIDRWIESDDPDHGHDWRPSIFMRRWACRLLLEVVSVRIERLQEITEDDARAEGAPIGDLIPAVVNGERGKVIIFDPVKAFQVLWESINGERPGCSWAANPWVWRVEFRRIEG